MNVLLTGSLLLLLVLVLTRRAKQGPKAEKPSERDVSRTARLSNSLARFGRRAHAEAPDPPRKRRNRPKLGLSVSGLPAVASLDGQHAIAQPGPPSPADDGNVAAHALGGVFPNDEQVAPTSQTEPGANGSPIDLNLASYVGFVAPVPLGSVHTETDRTVEAPMGNGGASVFIDAPGWPQPGEMGVALESFDPRSRPSIARGTALPGGHGELLGDRADYGDDAAFGSALGGERDDDPFDPARGWLDYAVATDSVPDAPPAEWTSDGTAATHAVTDAVNGDHSPSWDAHSWEAASDDAATQDAWEKPEWSWEPDEGEANVLPVVEVVPEGNASHDEVTLDETAAERATPATEDGRGADEAHPDEQTLNETTREWTPTIADVPAADATHHERSIAEASVEMVAPSPDAVPTPDFAMTDLAAPVPPATTKRDKRTKRLEKRLAIAEAELERIARRTTGKKGDLRKAGKKTIAKQVRKALSDPEMAHHFDVRVGKGQLAFARRTHELPVLRAVSAPTPSATGASAGADILAALQSPLRASLLAGLLADYANAEAERRVAEFLRDHAGPRRTPDDFDAFVARLANVSQGPLLGIDPSERTAR